MNHFYRFLIYFDAQADALISSPLYQSASYVLLWKLFSIIPINYEKDLDYVSEIVDVMIPFVKRHIDGRNDIAKYTTFTKDLAKHTKKLTFVFNSELFSIFHEKNIQIWYIFSVCLTIAV